MQPGARIDDDCDGIFDGDVTRHVWATDADVDGAGGTRVGPEAYCGAPAPGAVILAAAPDCDDAVAAVRPVAVRITDAAFVPLPLPVISAPPRDAIGELYLTSASAPAETCDGLDNDCAGGVDDGVQTTFYRDADNDGWGTTAPTVLACAAPAGFAAQAGDCRDDLSFINPGMPESCDGWDNDCQGGVDVGVPLGGSCTTSEPGICAAGTQTACVNAGYVCTRILDPELFDDPDPSTPVDEDCDGPEPVLYVDTGGSDSNPGTPAAPFATVTHAVQIAQSLGATQVYLSSGTHTITSPLRLVSGVDVVGGFTRSGNAWTWTGASSVIEHAATSQSGRAVVIEASGGVSATVAHLQVSLRASSDSGVDHYGIRVVDSPGLRLVDVAVNVPGGTDGAGGATGVDGASGASATSRTGAPGSCSGADVSGGLGGRNGSDGQPGQGPAGGRGGTGGTARDGGDGGGSTPGTAGGASTGATPLVFGDYWSHAPATGGGTGGRGSGGGGGFGINDAGRGGGGGAGGCGGAGGGAGEHGGSAFGILLVRSAGVTLRSVAVTVTGGGDGGAGGGGGRGGDGGTGASGEKGQDGDGGDGSAGGGGGGGGGGDGGHSYGLLVVGPPSPGLCSSFGADLTISLPGAPGVAGAGGARGPAGNLNSSQGGLGASGRPGVQLSCHVAQACDSVGDPCPSGFSCRNSMCFP
jgi:hypothetical protein